MIVVAYLTRHYYYISKCDIYKYCIKFLSKNIYNLIFFIERDNYMNFNIIVTNRCNLKCKYCYEKIKNSVDLKADLVDKIILFIKNEVYKYNPKRIKIIFHGGEPTLNFDIIKYTIKSLEEDVELPKVYEMTSNGFLINNEIKNYIYKNKINLSISIDGKKSDNDLNRVDKNGQGTYLQVINNVVSMLDMNINIRCRMTVTKSNILNLSNNINDLIEKGLNNFAIALDFFEDKWSQDDYYGLLSSLRELKTKYKNSKIRISLIDDLNTLAEKSDCMGGISSFTFDANGDVYPCLFAINNKKFLLGNLNKDKYVYIINKGKDLCRERYSTQSFCNKCNAEKICDGNRCKILSYIVKGDYALPVESLCITTRAIIESM